MSRSESEKVEVPERIGPYRVERPLGHGGMGEVYAGYDARLDRPVALKRVRPDRETAEHGGRDLRREARAVARLHHPAIVQVHDWVETETGDWIVLEMVEGRSLREVLREGPLAPHRAARLAADLLSGLAAAHGAGVVHRDLKAENVMVTGGPGEDVGGERAKILDFGLAERRRGRVPGPEGDGDEDEAGPVPWMGTPTAMSPEQALGRPVGARSDLFSLGSLLYEMITGVAPFYEASRRVTLQRICTFKPASVRSRKPDVPEELSALVDRLLEKDPRRRPASAQEALTDLEAMLADLPAESGDGHGATVHAGETGTPKGDPGLAFTTLLSTAVLDRLPVPLRHLAGWIAAGVLAAVLVGSAVWTYSGRERGLRYVAVPAPQVDARTEGLELAAGALHTALLRGLIGLQGLAVLEPAGSRGVEEDLGDDPLAWARDMAADEVLTSRLDCDGGAPGRGGACQASLRRLDASDGRVLWTRSFTLEIGNLLDLSLAVLGHVSGAYAGYRPRDGAMDLEVRAEDYETFLRLRRSYEGRELSPRETLAAVERLQKTSPRFLPLPLFEALVRIRQFQEERDAGELERAGRALARARDLAPDDPVVVARQAQVARIAGRLDEAEAHLETLLRLEPANALPLAQMALLRERQGEPEEALRLMRQAVGRLESTGHLFDLADMLSRRGDLEGARQTLERSLERSPDHFDGLSRLAQLELLSGSPERAATLYERLVERSPGVVELANLGTSFLLVGRYAEAAQVLRRAWEQAPASAPALLNLADAELLQGRTEEAEALYRQVIRLADEDPQPEALLTVRAQALAHLGRGREAVAAVEEALQSAPDNPQFLYEAALVYAVTGDPAAALDHARRAVLGGVDLRWFGFPWFDGVRLHLDPVTAPPRDSQAS